MSDADDTFSAAIKGKKRGSEEEAARSADAKLTRGPRKSESYAYCFASRFKELLPDLLILSRFCSIQRSGR